MDAGRISGARLGVIAGVAGAVVAIVLGLLTLGVPATASPHGLPLAVAVPEGAAGQALSPVLARLTEQGGEAVAWRATSPQQAAELLDDKEVYGVLELAPPVPGGRFAPTVVVSGALNSAGTQAAQQILVTAGQGIAEAVAAQVPGVTPGQVTTRTVHPTSTAAKALPLSASALLWLATLVASIAVVAVSMRGGHKPSTRTRLAAVGTATVLGPAVVLGFAWLWDSGISVPASAIAFLVLVAAAFALIQGAVLRLLGLFGIAILAPLYLMAPAVAALPGELVQPAYKVALWSWTPFRFSTETLRSLLYLDGSAPDVATGVIVFASLAVVGLVVVLWPSRRGTDGPEAPNPSPAGSMAAAA